MVLIQAAGLEPILRCDIIRGMRRPDTLSLYRWAVQDPRTMVTFLSLIHRHYTRRWPKRLREDFCGNAADAVEWLARGGERAIGVDLDAGTLGWGARRARRILGEHADRLQLVRADVRAVMPPAVPRVDVVAALNFSVLVFQARSDLLAYFWAARRGLRPGGVFVFTVFGGALMHRPGSVTRVVRGRAIYDAEPAPPAFDYEWEQRSYDAVHGLLDCRLHFTVRRPKRIVRNAFRYVCRLWSLPELQELLREAGFRRVEIWQHRDKGRGGVFTPVPRIDGERWVAYVVGA